MKILSQMAHHDKITSGLQAKVQSKAQSRRPNLKATLREQLKNPSLGSLGAGPPAVPGVATEKS